MTPTPDTVVISQIDGTDMWTWTRHYGVTVAVLDETTGAHTDETQEVIHSMASPFPFPDQANAIGHAKSVNADVTDPAAFIVES